MDDGHVFTTAGFHDDATCDNCHIGWLTYEKTKQPCQEQPDSQAGDELLNILKAHTFTDETAFSPALLDDLLAAVAAWSRKQTAQVLDKLLLCYKVDKVVSVAAIEALRVGLEGRDGNL